MQLRCPTCQASCPEGARFCPECGARLSQPRPELRVGTLLFCDLVESTMLANRLDHEDLLQVFAAFERAVRLAARRHEGYIDRVEGDGAFIVFGYPSVSEDSAVSAVAAGFDLVQAVQAIAAGAAGPLSLRVGIASGRVVMGEMIASAAFSGRAVSGAVANLAARLTAAAEPGAVVVCNDTRSLVGQHFHWVPLGPLMLKGFTDPVPAWQAIHMREQVSRFDALRPSGTDTALIGRDTALSELARHWDAAGQGEGHGVLVLGEAGIGKSSLARAAGNLLQLDRSLFIDVHCNPRTRLSPLYPVGMALRRLAGYQTGDSESVRQERAALLLKGLVAAEVLPQALSDLHDLFHMIERDATWPVADSPELVRERSIALLVDVILALCDRTSVLLLFEDLHWSDPSTLALLERLLQRASAKRLLVVITARQSELPAGLALPATQQLVLGPLDAESARHLVRRRASGGKLPTALVDRIVARGEGVPLYLEELTQATNSAFDLPGAAVELAADRAPLPTLLQTIMQSRLDRMPDLKPVLQAASVLGRELHWPLLIRVLGDATVAEDAITRLIDTGALVPVESVASARLRFKHGLIHDAVYDTLLRSERHRLHSLVADILQADPVSYPDHGSEVVAFHLSEAGRHTDAIDCLLRASRLAAAQAAYVESIGYADRGLAQLSHVSAAPTRRLLRLYLLAQKGVPMTALHGYAAPEVEQIYAEASELCNESTPITDLYPVLRGLGTYYFVRGQIDRADRLARQCLAIAQKSRQPELRICALSFAAYPAAYLGRLQESDSLSERAMQLYRSASGQDLVYSTPHDPATAALTMITTTAWLRGDLQRADDAAMELLAHIERLGRPFDIAYGKVWLAASYQLHRRHMQALQQAQPGLAVAQRHGLATWIPAAAMELFLAQGALGPSPEATAQLQAAHLGFLHHGAEVSATFYKWGIALSQLVAGDRSGALATADAGIERARLGQETYMRPELLIVRAAAQSDEEAACRDLIAALEHAQKQGSVTVALRAACELARRPGGTDAARALADEALQLINGGPTQGIDAARLRAHLVDLVQALAHVRKDLPDTRWLIA